MGRTAILAALTLAACARGRAPVHVASPNYICTPPPTIAGNEPASCWWWRNHDDRHTAWCVYDVGSCAGTWVREGCDAGWEQTWEECRFPLRAIPSEKTTAVVRPEVHHG